jgi:anthranilate synthase component I
MTKSEFERLCEKKYSHIPVVKTVPADLETPLSVYLKLANVPNTFLFESATGGERWGRYSIIGLSAEKLITIRKNTIIITSDYGKEILEHSNPLDFLENYQQQFNIPKIKELAIMPGGLVGYFGFESICYIEKQFKNNKTDDVDVPDISLMQTQNLAIFDNLTGQIHLISLQEAKKQNYKKACDFLTSLNKKINKPLKNYAVTKINFDGKYQHYTKEEEFLSAVAQVRERIKAGDIMQVVLSQKFSCNYNIDELIMYRAMRQINPSPYMYYLNFADFKIIGSSPEILVRLKDDKITVRPIAGTRARGKDSIEDERLVFELLNDPKELAEHLMLIDLGRNDLGRVAKIGSVILTEKMIVEKYSHVMHIVSNVEGTLKRGKSAMDVFKATHPAGTVSGAPKIKATQIIQEKEKDKRGVYSGAVGYFGFDGSLDTAIAIRTVIIKDKKLHIQAGAGIVYDSDPKKEYQETINKASAIFSAVKLAHRGLQR